MSIVEALDLQLSELEALQSIYLNDEEVVVQDEEVLYVMKQYVETNGASFKPEKRLGITLNLNLEESQTKLCIDCLLPITYPGLTLPEIFIRCDNLSRNKQQSFNLDLGEYMQTIEPGESCLYQVAQWATENAAKYLESSNDKDDATKSTSSESVEAQIKECIFSRFWIYSHHIYNKEKRKCILEWAKELDLTGFSMPGKPGVVCIEGPQDSCEDYWQRLRRQTWKRLSIVEREECCTSQDKLNDCRKFNGVLMEMDFGVHGGRDYHMDLGKFLEYLTEHNCQHLFPILFGVEGKKSNKT